MLLIYNFKTKFVKYRSLILIALPYIYLSYMRSKKRVPFKILAFWWAGVDSNHRTQ